MMIPIIDEWDICGNAWRAFTTFVVRMDAAQIPERWKKYNSIKFKIPKTDCNLYVHI